MNPDVFAPVPIPEKLSRYFRRAMVAFCYEDVGFDVVVRGTGYSYLGWTPCGRWRGVVNGKVGYDCNVAGPLHLSGQVYDGFIEGRFSGCLRQIFCEFTALGQYELLGIEGQETFERACDPSTRLPRMKDVKTHLAGFGVPESSDALATAFFSQLSGIEPAKSAPDYLHKLVGTLENASGEGKFSDLVADIGVSERKARDDFRRIVGLTPKRFSKLLQINTAFNALMSLGESRLADLAAECGFSDQAHMTRSFVEFLGDTPVKFAKDIEPTLKQFVGFSRDVRRRPH